MVLTVSKKASTFHSIFTLYVRTHKPVLLASSQPLPLAVLMDKGIIIGVESELMTRVNLPFVMFRQATSVSCFFDIS